MAAGVPFSVAAVAAHGTAGLVVGAAVALLSALVSALVSSDRVFWLLTLLLLNRHQRWAWAQTRSIASTRRLDEPARRTVETIARARQQ